MVCQASALPLSYAPRFKIREGFIYSELFPKSTPNFRFPDFFGDQPVGASWHRVGEVGKYGFWTGRSRGNYRGEVEKKDIGEDGIM